MIQTTPQEERRDVSYTSRVLGHVVKCNGARATISARVPDDENAIATTMSVGRLISIRVGNNRVVALVYSIHSPGEIWLEREPNTMHFEVELVGEIRGDDSDANFSAGISDYPTLGAVAHQIRMSDLDAIYSVDADNPVNIGHLTQNSEIPSCISADALLNRHFAIVGTTGVGKSTAVSLLVNRIVDVCPDLRVLILDPHNEFASAFKTRAHLIETDTLDLPFWLFRLEEFTEVIFRGRPAVAEEIDMLRDLIAEAKRNFRGDPESAMLTRKVDRSSITADTPIPYRVADLMALIDERIGQLDGRDEKPHLRNLKMRIGSVINDPRFRFMFSTNTINDNLIEIISEIFRIPGDGKPITSFQLSGIPSEVVNAVASVLCRMAFEIALWSNGQMRILVLCEEAHRYVPSDPSLGFFPTRQAVARIAKEGRKYGVSLGVITQRPGELDPTILSQCSTVFAMRLANDRDQDIIRSAISNSSSSTISFLSSIGNGEAIAFGEAVAVPMRMCFERVPQSELPQTVSGNIAMRGMGSRDQLPNIGNIVKNMRHTETPLGSAGMPPQGATLQPALGDLAELEKAVSGPAAPIEDKPMPDQPAPGQKSLGSVRASELRESLLAKSPHRASLLKKSDMPTDDR
ncbi:ATP-binding protein [Hoeflea prorocentri]|uniref:ATP-binding protein n=1 Tax=Hoeflea prorocentri TaxID=1922333 RepID=A0A9X3ZFR2_9HYPH|nr:ATP-binding protein [Hoeflea prorocentri]MCY6379977.1 ATP-binding protein [Hoeflea prorocentri]MDA5397777.1 ATP-binding protein [Hoeflea prorocentri]